MRRDTTSRGFFDAKYANDPDPWNFASSAYETFRYNTTIGTLEGRHYRRAFEPGCSVGVLTAKLAALCKSVEAIEISPLAVERARERCRHLPHVQINAGALPEDIPEGTFDLIVLSEIGYYFERDALREITRSLAARLTPGGTLLAVHWLGNSADHPLSGAVVHDVIGATAGLLHTFSATHGNSPSESFLLERWRRT